MTTERKPTQLDGILKISQLLLYPALSGLVMWGSSVLTPIKTDIVTTKAELVLLRQQMNAEITEFRVHKKDNENTIPYLRLKVGELVHNDFERAKHEAKDEMHFEILQKDVKELKERVDRLYNRILNRGADGNGDHGL